LNYLSKTRSNDLKVNRDLFEEAISKNLKN
jgi:hypothetical protein